MVVRTCRLLVAALTLTLALATVACASPRGRIFVNVGPPAPIIETRVVAPGPGYLWLPGFYSWNGAAYVWVPGRWERPARARARWVPGRWVHDRRGWYFVEGRWR
jgi:WXXGXW repeat (2 copies)